MALRRPLNARLTGLALPTGIGAPNTTAVSPSNPIRQHLLAVTTSSPPGMGMTSAARNHLLRRLPRLLLPRRLRTLAQVAISSSLQVRLAFSLMSSRYPPTDKQYDM